ncbi:uncharacterized protein LOC110880453 [Helianthus annuus]|uniref:uncharacterized protein LOC110880453 n=1 Tax=Helianthus annuus TaxID=4232 RepID=UPI000B908087|nr:uncharacterized protein LOC110880453 [Helianthus annuus]
METHVDASKVYEVCKKVCPSWSWVSNVSCCSKGTRIMVGWEANLVDVMILDQSDQNRRSLWENLCRHHSFMKDKPWALMGDFNCSLFLDDSLAGSSTSNIGMEKFKECVNSIEVLDINSSGLHFTWSNKQQDTRAIFKKIDRILGNMKFIDTFQSASALFHPYRISDHTPCILVLPNIVRDKPKPFKFVNLLADKKEFMGEVERVWGTDIRGVTMFQVVRKLKLLKTPMRKLMQQQGNLHERVKRVRKEMDDCQRELDGNPTNGELMKKQSEVLQLYKIAVRDEALFLQQKSKVDWLALGDSNTRYFHNVVKAKNHRSRIFSVRDASGKVFEGGSVPQAFVDHYTQFFGTTMNVNVLPTPDLFHSVLSAEKAGNMVREVTDDEIKKALFSIQGNKAPGPDGYTSVKIISNRIKEGLLDIVSINQSAFVPGRRISDNILLKQELMHNYHRNVGPPRCAFQIDIQKAYDTVEWRFLEATLKGFGFHVKMVNWIMACVSSSTFSLAINGNLFGYFKGKRGLRQGDPMSPYLFTLVMEVLTLLLQKQVSVSNEFRFHNKCERQRIINLCFADDLFMFARGDQNSAIVIMNAMKEFKMMSGLVPSLTKSTVFFGNVSD